MIDLDQEIKITWNKANRQLYLGYGFQFTNYGDTFIITPRQLKLNSAVKATVTCDDCGKSIPMPYNKYNRTTNNQTKEYYCKSCAHKNIHNKRSVSINKFNEFLDFCERNGYKPITTIDDYIGVKTPVYYECPQHGIHSILLDNLKEDSIGCKKCYFEKIGNSRSVGVEKCIEIIESKGNKLLNSEDYINTTMQNLWVECGSCHKPFLTSLYSQMQNSGVCKKCANENTRKGLALTQERLNEIYNSDSMVLLNPEEYINAHERNLRFACRICGKSFVTSRVHYDAGCDRCPECSGSKSVGEETIEKYLVTNGISFIPQKRFHDCKDKKPLPFDFYLPDSNICIEFDGQQHFEPKWGIERLKTTQYHDKIKDEYCRKNNITLIRIPYWEGHHIQEILNEKLS